MFVLTVAGVLSVAGLLATLADVNFPNANSTLHEQERWISNSTEKIRCQAPELDPFSEEVTIYERIPPKIRCLGQDWVKCYHSKCRVVDAIKYIVTDIKCTFSDIIYEDGYNYTLGPPQQLVDDDFYELKESDHVKVACDGTLIEGSWFTRKNTRWSGNVLGLRAVRPPPAPPGRERTPSVLIFGFHSAGRHAFIRHMPKSWQMLKKIGATVMEGYNVVGETTRDALMPILSGRVWKNPRESVKFDPDSLIFSKLKQDGYRTAYFEDRPDIGMFQHYFNGFARQPADHYLRALLMADWFDIEPAGYRKYKKESYCVGDTPKAKFMMSITEQFLELGGKGFIFTFISGITHDDFDQISNADDDTAAFLHRLLSRTEDTLIVVMGDHGPRLPEARKHLRQGKLERLLPLLAIRLPDRLTRARPHAQRALEANARALTTPHDLHATILDILDMRQHSNPHIIEEAAYPRALTMLEQIPRNRSCSEAGIVPDYCACIIWQNASADDPMFHKPARALVDYINLNLNAVGNSTERLQQSIDIQCKAPELDPFSKEITQYDKILPDIQCLGQDWVKCYHSKCRVVDAIKYIIKDIKCTFSDIIYEGDFQYDIGPPLQLVSDAFYELKESDHVKVACVGTWKEGYWFRPKNTSWSGNVLGLRAVRPPPAPPGRERTPSVVIFGFDSAARHAFIRHMPKSWEMLKKIGATVMEGYNVVGEATREALMPILSGRVWRMPSGHIFDPNNLIFSKLKQDGYRTAYFEDRPDIGTFQYFYDGFARQPTDHYLRALLLADWFDSDQAGYGEHKKKSYCLGDTPQFKVMINMTQQFLEMDGKGFIFTFISDISHDDLEMIRNADDDTAAFLHGLLSRTEDTLIVVMGDHGPRYSDGRNHLRQGKLEHLLPLLAIRLPDQVTRARPHAQRALEANARALTTPHDLHATILDVLDMRQHSNPYIIEGAAYPRALTMLEPIPYNRTCFDAGIEPHYCACITWQNVSADDPMFHKPAHALVDYINSLLSTAGDLCVPRTLNSTLWVLRQADNQQTAHSGALHANENYQVKIVTDPAGAMFEATMSYSAKEDKFTTDSEFINRVNRYSHEPDCVRWTQPYVNAYCYCRDLYTTHQQQRRDWRLNED